MTSSRRIRIDDDGTSAGAVDGFNDVLPSNVILEVGGLDLRNNCIGVEEWADMVHFVRHVGRPLEMVMARDKAFVAPMPPAGAATTSTTNTIIISPSDFMTTILTAIVSTTTTI